MFIPGEKSFYKGFMIVEYPAGIFNAYRSMEYYKAGTATYTARVGESIEILQVFIDVADDKGLFTLEELGSLG